METILLILIITGAVICWVWFSRRGTKMKEKQKNPVYVCPECGNLHCNCYLEKDEDVNAGGKSDGR